MMGEAGDGEAGGAAPEAAASRRIDPARAAGRLSSDVFLAAVEMTRMPITVTDPYRPDNPIIFCNRAFIKMTGYAADEIIGRNCRFLQGQDTDAATVVDIRAAVRERREMATEILNYRKDGSAFWNALFISPVYDEDGRLLHFFASQLDVSRRRDAEEALRHAQRMEALGQLTGGIAHDFNNLLQVIVGYADMARANPAARGEARLGRALEQIQGAAERASTLTQHLLAFSRRQRLEGRVVNLNELIGDILDKGAGTLGEAVAVRRELAPSLPNARLDAVQAEVAILNILGNARDAMPDGGTVTVATGAAHVAAGDRTGDRAGPADLPPGPYVVVRIGDTGGGMAPALLARVADPFFTTKGEGTGLGLSMVFGFMKQSGGGLHIASAPGEGTEVSLFFPAVDEHAGERPRRGTPAGERDHGTERILIVDDRADVAGVASSILQEFGYVTTVANGPADALALLDSPAGFDMLFSDLVMPGAMNGAMLAREARRRRPQIKVLLTTGFADVALERADVGGVEFDLIGKPYRRIELARKVRRVLEGPTGVG